MSATPTMNPENQPELRRPVQPSRASRHHLRPAAACRSRIRFGRHAGGLFWGLVLCGVAASLGVAEIVIRQGVDKTKSQPAQAGFVVPPPAAGENRIHEDTVEFLNGDRLSGTFLSADRRGGARWQHAAIGRVITLDLASLARVRLDRPQATNSYPAETCGVRLSNRDELVGELVSLDENNLNLKTWYAGSLSIPRRMVSSISPGRDQSGPVYEGPTGTQGWTMQGGPNNQAWQFSDGAFVNTASGSIGRMFKLPAQGNIEFDLAYRGYLQLAVSVYSDKLERYGGNAYMLQFSYTSVYLQRMPSNGSSSSLGQSQVPDLARKTKVHVSIRCSKEQRLLALLIDGVLVKQWSDREDFPDGSGLLFSQQGQGLSRISNIRISEWDGKLEEPAGEDPKAPTDFVRLANNDKVTGTIKTILDGKLSLETQFATLTVPLERVTRIDLALAESEAPAAQAGSVRAVFARQGSITFELERWDDRQVVGSSPSFGRAKFLPAAFTQIEFNLEQPRKAPPSDELSEEDEGVILFE